MKRLSTSRQDSRLFVIVTAVVTVTALYFGRVVFIPFALALLFSLILAPIVTFLEKIKLPRTLAILVVVVSLFCLAGAAAWITSQQFVALSIQLPEYAQALKVKLHSNQRLQNSRLGKFSDTLTELGKELAAAIPGSGLDESKGSTRRDGSSPAKPLAVTVVAPTNPLQSIENMLGPLFNVVVIAVFTIFILVGREDLRDRFIRLVGGRRLNVMTRAMDETTQRINRYLLLQLIVNLGYGMTITTALYFLGMPNAALWGTAATVLRFLPYVGPPLAAVMPILISIAIFPGWLHVLGVVALYSMLELIVANVVEPIIYGAHVGLSPLAILISAVFWTLIWGFAGLLLSTPLTVCLVVMGRYSPKLAFLNIILGDEPVLPPHAQYYQRLLATDQNEARQILDRYRKENSLEETYSSLLLPALSLAEQDRHRNELDEDAEAFVYQSTREFVDELGDSDTSPNGIVSSRAGSGNEAAAKTRVLCVAARDEADEIAAMGLCQLLSRQGFRANIARVNTAGAILRQVKTQAPEVVCISALPPFAMEHARALYAKLRARFEPLHIIICFWQFEGDIQKTAARFKLHEGDALVTTLPDAINHLNNYTRQRVVPDVSISNPLGTNVNS